MKVSEQTMTSTIYPIEPGQLLKITKGCRARDLDKGVTIRVREVTPMGPDYSHCVRVVFSPTNGFKAGKLFAFYARHINRLTDNPLRLNDGNPSNVIEAIRR